MNECLTICLASNDIANTLSQGCLEEWSNWSPPMVAPTCDEQGWFSSFNTWAEWCQIGCNLYGTYQQFTQEHQQTKPNLIFGLTQEQLLLVAGAFIAIKALK